MLKRENIFVGSISVFCILYLYFALQIPLGSPSKPSVGFLPVIFAIVGLILSIGIIITNIIRKEYAESETFSKESVKRIIGYILAVLFFVIAFQKLGAIISVFALILVVSKICGYDGWIKPIIFSLICSAITFVIFDMLLGVTLPTGFFN